MKDKRKSLKVGLAVFAAFFFAVMGYAQGGLNLSVNKQFGVEVRLEGNLYKQVSQSKLKRAKVISDINEGFPASWIESYVSTELKISLDGKEHTASGKDHELSPQQLELLSKTDYGTELSMDISYFPNNTLSSNESKNIRFTYIVTPETPAEYIGGFQSMRNYLTENTLDKLETEELYKMQMATVLFTIDEKGNAINARLGQSSNNKTADRLILETIKTMPPWSPAVTAKGTSVSQNFIFFVGDQIGC